MTKQNLHIVHRQIVEAKLPTEETALDFQQRISQLCEKELPGMLDHLCNMLNLGNDLLHIPRLEIDLGTLPSESWEPVFMERCSQQLRRALDKKKAQAVSSGVFSLPFSEGFSGQQMRVSDKNNGHDRMSDLSAISKDTQAEDRLFTIDHQVLRSFIEFLRTGNLASAVVVSDFAGFEDSIVEALQKITPKEALYRWWDQIMKSNWQIAERLGKQFSMSFHQRFMNLLWGIHAQKWQSLWDSFQTLLADTAAKSTLPVARQNYCFVSALIHTLNRQGRSFDVEQVQRECLAIWKQQLNTLGGRAGMAEIAPSASPVEETAQDRESEREEPERVDYFIENGGLVIVAPFLPTLYRELKWVDKQEFLHTDLQEKAIQLTQYLMTGEEQSPEFLLPLNKLLCGWPLQKPLIRETELTEKEKEEGNDMLKAVIKHWGKIGQASIGALQETFLQRKATLRYRRGYQEWHLHVERKDGIDILVERIPWTISMVKLPWMQDRIQVEWV